MIGTIVVGLIAFNEGKNVGVCLICQVEAGRSLSTSALDDQLGIGGSGALGQPVDQGLPA